AAVSRRAVLRVAGAAELRALFAAQPRGRVLLSVDRRTCPAPAGRPVRVGPDVGAPAHCRSRAARAVRPGEPERTAVQRVLALPAAGLAGTVRGAAVDLRSSGGLAMTREPTTVLPTALQGLQGVSADWSADRQTFPVPWGKA